MPWMVGVFLGGSCAFFYVGRLFPPILLLLLTASTLAFVPRAVRNTALRLPLALAAGVLWAAVVAHFSQPPRLPWTDLGKTWEARLQIIELPTEREGRARFVAQVTDLDDGARKAHGHWRVQLSWRNPPRLRLGQLWRVPLRLKPVNSYRNVGSWDYARWLYHRGIRYRGYIAKGEFQLLGQGRCCRLEALREALRDRLRGAGQMGPGRALLLALVLGDRSGLRGDMRHVLATTGTSHLVAISGLHVSLLAGLVGALAAGLWRRSRFARSTPAMLAGALAGLGAGTAYALLSGFGLPARRAVLMLAMGVFLLWSRRRIRPADGLALVVLVVVLFDPMAVTEAGFWLSFLAVAAILALLPQMRARPLWLRAVIMQAGISLALVPPLLLFDMSPAPLGLLVNLVAVPLFSLLLIPLALLATLVAVVPPGFEQPLDWTVWLLSIAYRGLEWAAAQSPAIGWPKVTPLRVALMAFGVVWMLFAPGIRARMPGLGLILALQLPSTPYLPEGAMTLDVLDVGQGLSAVIRTRHHVLVYDTGPAFGGGFNLADAVVLPWLRHQGIDRVDRLVLSHGDKDHAGAADSLVRGISSAEILSGEPQRVPVTARRCASGDAWHWDGVDFRFIQPAWSAGRHGNNASCVLLVVSAGGKLLLTGDAEDSVEAAMAERLRDEAPISVVVAGHHGSSTSSSPEFVRAVRADHVIYASGYRNRYGFPRPDVDTRWAAAGARRWRTDGCGTVHADFSVRQRRARISTVVQGPPPYWWPDDVSCELVGPAEAP